MNTVAVLILTEMGFNVLLVAFILMPFSIDHPFVPKCWLVSVPGKSFRDIETSDLIVLATAISIH